MRLRPCSGGWRRRAVLISLSRIKRRGEERMRLWLDCTYSRLVNWHNGSVAKSSPYLDTVNNLFTVLIEKCILQQINLVLGETKNILPPALTNINKPTKTVRLVFQFDCTSLGVISDAPLYFHYQRTRLFILGKAERERERETENAEISLWSSARYVSHSRLYWIINEKLAMRIGKQAI